MVALINLPIESDSCSEVAAHDHRNVCSKHLQVLFSSVRVQRLSVYQLAYIPSISFLFVASLECLGLAQCCAASTCILHRISFEDQLWSTTATSEKHTTTCETAACMLVRVASEHCN